MEDYFYLLEQNISLEEIRASKPKTIFYGANTCWWTHDPSHLNTTTNGLPCDSRGGVLMQTNDVEGFLASAEENAEHYGPFGLTTFLASHHLNCSMKNDDGIVPWCFSQWSSYTAVLTYQQGKLIVPTAATPTVSNINSPTRPMNRAARRAAARNKGNK